MPLLRSHQRSIPPRLIGLTGDLCGVSGDRFVRHRPLRGASGCQHPRAQHLRTRVSDGRTATTPRSGRSGNRFLPTVGPLADARAPVCACRCSEVFCARAWPVVLSCGAAAALIRAREGERERSERGLNLRQRSGSLQSGEGEWAGGIVGLERNYEVVEELTAECEYLMQVLKTMDARCARCMCVSASPSSCAWIEGARAAGCGQAHVDVTRGVRERASLPPDRP